MKTLIELYDERPLENVLSTEMFSPETTVFLCPPEVDADASLKADLRAYFRARGCRTDIRFFPVSLLDASKVAQSLEKVVRQFPDCALDIAGGTDAALFAAGLVSAGTDLPVFTYSRKKNTFFEIRSAPFARGLYCPVELRVSDCFLMAGGEMMPGRVDNRQLAAYLPLIDGFFAAYLRFRSQWTRIVTYIQHISRQEKGPDGLYTAQGPAAVRENGSTLTAPEDALRCFESLGLIRDLTIGADGVRFVFADENACFFLRDIGSVLELYTYKTALDTGLFQDVCLSAMVGWENGKASGARVTNELDVVAVRGVMPVFISCKTSEIKTEALNELAILRDRFGSSLSRAVIVSSSGAVRSVTRRRAFELGIDVIDLDDLETPEAFRERLAGLIRWPEQPVS